MDLPDIRKLVRLMQQAELSELEIDDTNRGLRIHLKRGLAGQIVPAQALGPVVQVMPNPAVPPPVPEPAAPAPASVEEGGEVPAGTELLKSPMVGTFYRAPSPDAESFAEVGKEIDEETVVCIIEAMKVMNEIKAEMKGVIAEILVENGEPVEFGQPLFLIRKG